MITVHLKLTTVTSVNILPRTNITVEDMLRQNMDHFAQPWGIYNIDCPG